MTKLEEIKQAAAEQFYASGYGAADLRSIASAVSLHVSTLYGYISSKEELLFMMMRDELVGLNARVEAAVAAHEGPYEQMRAAIEAHIVYHAERKFAAWIAHVEIRSLTGKYRRQLIKLRDGYETRWLELLGSGIEAGVFAECDRKVTTYLLVGLGHGVANWFQPAGRLTPEQIAAEMADRVLGGLRVRT